MVKTRSFTKKLRALPEEVAASNMYENTGPIPIPFFLLVITVIVRMCR